MAWESARPLAGFEGGLMIGLASVIMLLALGRIAGISGLAARAIGVAMNGAPQSLAFAFIAGLPIGAFLFAQASGAPLVRMPASPSLLLIAGLLVGYGTRLGSGCTSGHGVCGLSRLSMRSIAATMVFMAAGIATVWLMRMAGYHP